LILGDNIFYGHSFTDLLKDAAASLKKEVKPQFLDIM